MNSTTYASVNSAHSVLSAVQTINNAVLKARNILNEFHNNLFLYRNSTT